MRWRSIVAAVLLAAVSVQARERVLKLGENQQGRNTTFRYPELVVGPDGFVSDVSVVSFFVLTQDEVEAAIAAAAAKTDREITQRHDTLAQVVDEKLRENEARLRRDVVSAIDALPQRVLADTAARALEDRILASLREEMAQMRKDLQAQIDVLRAAQPNR